MVTHGGTGGLDELATIRPTGELLRAGVLGRTRFFQWCSLGLGRKFNTCPTLEFEEPVTGGLVKSLHGEARVLT